MPESAEVFNSYVAEARSAEKEGRLIEAASFLRKALDINPNEQSLYNWLGWIRYALGEHQDALALAMVVNGEDAPSYLGSLRLRAFLGMDAGKLHHVDALVEEARTIDDSFASTLCLELSEHLLSILAASGVATSKPIPFVIADQLPNFLLDPQNRIGRKVVMAIAALAVSELDYDTCTAVLDRRRDRTKPARHRNMPFAATTIITSIAPTRLEIQQRAILSWLHYGAKVVSFNAEEEIEQLHQVMPNVRFASLPRNAKDAFGKPYPYIDDMLRGALACDTQTVGLFNADIVLGDKQHDNILRAVRRSKSAMVVGHRLDVDDSSSPEIGGQSEVYAAGFDWFLLERESIDRISAPNLVFGCPWWDLWLPIAALATGLSVMIDRECLVYHEKHDARWAEQAYRTLGRACLANLTALNPPEAARSRPVRLLRSIAADAGVSILNDVEEQFTLDWLAGIMRTVITSQSVTSANNWSPI